MFIMPTDECLCCYRALAIPGCDALTPSPPPPPLFFFVQSASLPHTPLLPLLLPLLLLPLPCLSNGLRRLLVTVRGGAAWLASVLPVSMRVLSTN